MWSGNTVRWDTGSSVRGGVRGFTFSECTFVVAHYKRATHHVKQGCVQWKSIMLWCTSTSGFLASVRKTVWRHRLCALFDYLRLSLRMRPDVPYVVRTHWGWWHTWTYNDTHRARSLGSARYKDEFSHSVCRCSIVQPKYKIRSVLDCPAMQKRSLRKAERLEAKSKHMECLQYVTSPLA